jgi:hypothetical protein
VLHDLLEQPANVDAFVIFEVAPSGKFVQFCGSASEPLQLDLPAQTLSELEFYRAVAYFKRLGVVGQEYDIFSEPGGLPVSRQFSFQMSLDSVDAAADVAMDVFEDVYRFESNWDLEITRGWQLT